MNCTGMQAYVRVNQELTIKSRLDELGIENFLPMNEQVRDTPGGKKKIRDSSYSRANLYSSKSYNEFFPN